VTEGVANAKPVLNLALTEDRYVDITRITECRTKVNKKVDITCTGPIAASPYAYKLFLEFPQMLYEDAQYPLSGPGKVVPDIVLRGQRAAAAPTGMSGLILPMRATLTNLTNVSALT
jgi:hypothetical protein